MHKEKKSFSPFIECGKDSTYSILTIQADIQKHILFAHKKIWEKSKIRRYCRFPNLSNPRNIRMPFNVRKILQDTHTNTHNKIKSNISQIYNHISKFLNTTLQTISTSNIAHVIHSPTEKKNTSTGHTRDRDFRHCTPDTHDTRRRHLRLTNSAKSSGIVDPKVAKGAVGGRSGWVVVDPDRSGRTCRPLMPLQGGSIDSGDVGRESCL